MKLPVSSLLLLFSFSGLFVGCSDDVPGAAPLTPQQKHEKAQALLKPSIELPASDYKGAIQLLREAAAQGYVPAMVDLAGIYLGGSKDGSIKKDRIVAFDWYRKAAEAGSIEAVYSQGFIRYDEGNVEAAVPYLQRAADAGVPEAQYLLGRILLQQRDVKAVEYIRKAATSDRAATVARAAYTMAVVYQKGWAGEKIDLPQSVEWFKRSADAGDPRALHLVGLMYIQGAGVEKDEPRGVSMLKLSAGQDYPAAIKDYITYLQTHDAAAHADEIRAWVERLKELSRPESR
ncbi:MAG: tetratricopeptide repeat protein [Akkermansia sp.]|nr:tetratricopeptide repeat protein [Akkermansia sp.]